MWGPTGEEGSAVTAGDGEGEVIGCVEACGAYEDVEGDVGGGGEFDAGGGYAFDGGCLEVDLYGGYGCHVPLKNRKSTHVILAQRLEEPRSWGQSPTPDTEDRNNYIRGQSISSWTSRETVEYIRTIVGNPWFLR